MIFGIPDEKWKKAATLFFLILYILYPLFSLLLGHQFPKMITLVMPCPIVALAMTLLMASKERIDKVLFILLLIWALTGFPKSIMFNAYEDIILFLSGLYGIVCYVTSKQKHQRPLLLIPSRNSAIMNYSNGYFRRKIYGICNSNYCNSFDIWNQSF